MAEVDLYPSPGCESIDVEGLAAGFGRVAFHTGGEIPGQGELLAGFQQRRGELWEVELPRGTQTCFQEAVVQVVAVDVGDHPLLAHRQERRYLTIG